MVTARDAQMVLERAINRYVGLHAEEYATPIKKKIEAMGETMQILNKHLQSVEISSGVVTASIGLRLEDIVSQLRLLGFGIGARGVKTYLTQITKETNLQYKLQDYQTRLYANR